MIRTLIIGGYGNFGSTIATRLARHENIQLLIAGRTPDKCKKFCEDLNPKNTAQPITLDINDDITDSLKKLKPDLVIHTSGPFQGQDYTVAKSCIAAGCHYCDLADGRDFVTQTHILDADAKAANVAIITGASSVPTLTAAILDEFTKDGFQPEHLNYGIATAQQTRLGRATTAATLSYAGKPLKTLIDGTMQTVYGWQNLHIEKYPILGLRLMSNVDVPDLDIFPARYPTLKTQRFYAGVEVKLLQIGIWLLSWPVRWNIFKNLRKYAGNLSDMAGLFDPLGSDKSGFHLIAKGCDKAGAPTTKSIYLIAKSGHGPNIPCMPAVLYAESLAKGNKIEAGARPCLDEITLNAYLDALSEYDITHEISSL